MSAVSDPISDFLTRIRNAQLAENRFFDVNWSKMKESIAKILKNEGMIENYLVKQNDKGGTMRVFLKYAEDRTPVIQGLKRVSKPGLRKYVSHDNIPNFFGGLGIAIVSTSKGVMNGKDAARQKLGGELLCMVW